MTRTLDRMRALAACHFYDFAKSLPATWEILEVMQHEGYAHVTVTTVEGHRWDAAGDTTPEAIERLLDAIAEEPRDEQVIDGILHADDSYGACIVCRMVSPQREDVDVAVRWPCPTVRLARMESER